MASLDERLVSKQAYDVIVHLDLPRSPPNIAAGNFMIDFKLLGRLPPAANGPLDDSDVLMRSRRPTMLTYSSPFVNWVLVTASVPWILLGWRREDEQLHVPVLEDLTLSRGSRTMPKALRLELEASQRLMVYKAHVEFVARFSGLRYGSPRPCLTVVLGRSCATRPLTFPFQRDDVQSSYRLPRCFQCHVLSHVAGLRRGRLDVVLELLP